MAAADELIRTLARHPIAALSAPPGSGKTTALPLALREADWLGQQRILVLEPRRLAARLAAERMAWLLGEDVGQGVGYQVRGERRIGRHTRIEVLTEGLLTRRLQADPELPGVGLVIFDEFHERSLQVDLALALALEARSLVRPDLRLLVMSATLDVAALDDCLGGAPLVRAEGRRFPVELRYAGGGRAPDVADAAIAATRRALAECPAEPGSDVLVFLPGVAEIRRVESAFAGVPDLAVHPLYSALPASRQQAAVTPDPDGRRKLILATNIAQTSITIDGVGVVVDGGYVRQARIDLGAGADRLETVRVSRATAEQRAGRAGRQRPGVAYRAWNEETQSRLAPHDEPEIERSDLGRLALEVHAWGTPVDRLPLPSRPPAVNWAAACDGLRALGAIHDGRITAHGRRLLALPLAPRLAALMLAATEADCAETGAWLSALLEQGGAGADVDLAASLAGVRRRAPASLKQEVRRLLRAVDRNGGWQPDAAGELIARAFPERIARRRRQRSEAYAVADGGEAALPRGQEPLPGEWVAIAHWQPGETRRIRLAAPVSSAAFDGALRGLVEEGTRVRWDASRERVVGRRGRFVGALELAGSEVAVDDALALPMLVDQLQRRGVDALAVTPAAEQLMARCESLRRWNPDAGWPTVTLEALLARAADWLPAWGAGMRSLKQLRELDLVAVIEAELGHERVHELGRLAPSRLTVPSGSRVALHYRADGEAPALAVRLQEMFGARRTPCVNGGAQPVSIHLLSPARRPIQITQDLEGFWKGSYADVRKDMRARYPKHQWPENPLDAEPTQRTVKRKP